MLAESFWTFKITDVVNALILMATIVAIIYGPIKAVEITRRLDREREALGRKRHVLATLMRTRRTSMHPDHVGALNLVQLEFHETPKVLAAYRAYIANLSEH